eukprot:1770275-Rhodomonas_salina.1
MRHLFQHTSGRVCTHAVRRHKCTRRLAACREAGRARALELHDTKLYSAIDTKNSVTDKSTWRPPPGALPRPPAPPAAARPPPSAPRPPPPPGPPPPRRSGIRCAAPSQFRAAPHTTPYTTHYTHRT